MIPIWITSILIATSAVALPQVQKTNNILSNSKSYDGQVLGNTIINYNAPPGSTFGSFTATIPGTGNALSNLNSPNGKITGNTIVNYHAAGSKTDLGSAQENVLSNVDSASGNISNNRIINYYGSRKASTHRNRKPHRQRNGISPGVGPMFMNPSYGNNF